MQTATEPLSQQERLRSRGICVVIPTYNNETTIADVAMRACQQCDDVIVVDDGSTDSTPQLLRDISGINVVTLPHNSGKGMALKAGFREAMRQGFAYAITLDADGQHFPEDIPLLLAANQQHPGALLVGQRKDLDSMERSGGSKFANAFSNFWFCVQTGRRLSDTQTGYRLYPLRHLHGLSLLTSRYEAELELLVFAAWHGVRLVQVPVRVYYPPREERVSHFRPTYDFARISVLNTVLCVLAVCYALPLLIIRKTLSALRTIYSLLFFLIFSMLIMTPLAMLYIRIGKMTEQKRLRLHGMLQFMSRVVMTTHGIPGVKSSIGNDHAEDFSRPAIIICNHQSHLDLMPMLQLSRKIVVLTKDWVWNNPFYGYVIRQAEFYPVSNGMDDILPRLRSLVSRGYSIVVYPEGTRSEDCSILRFHQGAFYLAEQLGIDILPTVLYGTGKVLPKTAHHLSKGHIHIAIDRRFTPHEQAVLGSLKERASWFRKYYRQRYASLCDRFEQL